MQSTGSPGRKDLTTLLSRSLNRCLLGGEQGAVAFFMTYFILGDKFFTKLISNYLNYFIIYSYSYF